MSRQSQAAFLTCPTRERGTVAYFTQAFWGGRGHEQLNGVWALTTHRLAGKGKDLPTLPRPLKWFPLGLDMRWSLLSIAAVCGVLFGGGAPGPAQSQGGRWVLERAVCNGAEGWDPLWSSGPGGWGAAAEQGLHFEHRRVLVGRCHDPPSSAGQGLGMMEGLGMQLSSLSGFCDTDVTRMSIRGSPQGPVHMCAQSLHWYKPAL